MNVRDNQLFQAAEAIVPLAGSMSAGFVGYDIALRFIHDGKKALIGFGPGTAVFALMVIIFMLLFSRRYKAFGGSPILVVLVSSALPLIGVLSLALGLLTSA